MVDYNPNDAFSLYANGQSQPQPLPEPDLPELTDGIQTGIEVSAEGAPVDSTEETVIEVQDEGGILESVGNVAGDVIQGLGAGVAGAFIETSDFIDQVSTDINKTIIPSNVQEQVRKFNPGLHNFFFETADRPNPLGEEQDSLAGNITQDISQFATGFYLVGGAAAKVGKALQASKGLSQVLSKIPDKVGDVIGAISKASTADAVAFDEHESNLANGLLELTDSSPEMASIIGTIATSERDDFYSGRFKNALASQFGEVGALALLRGVRHLKKLKRGTVEEAEATAKEFAELDELFPENPRPAGEDLVDPDVLEVRTEATERLLDESITPSQLNPEQLDDVAREIADRFLNGETYSYEDLYADINPAAYGDDLNSLLAAVKKVYGGATLISRKRISAGAQQKEGWDALMPGLLDDAKAEGKSVNELLGRVGLDSIDKTREAQHTLHSLRHTTRLLSEHAHRLAVEYRIAEKAARTGTITQLDLPKLRNDYQQTIANFHKLTQIEEALKSEFGRGLQIAQQGVDTDTYLKRYRELLKERPLLEGQLDDKAIDDLMSASGATTPAAGHKFLKDVIDATDSNLKLVGDVVVEVFINSILSGISTIKTAAIGSGMLRAVRSLEQAQAAAIQDIPSALQGKGLPNLSEVLDEHTGMVRGMTQSLIAVSRTLAHGRHAEFDQLQPIFKKEPAIQASSFGYQPGGPIEALANAWKEKMGIDLSPVVRNIGGTIDGVGDIVNAPTQRFLASVDAFWGTLNNHGVLWRESMKEGRLRGLEGAQLEKYAEDRASNMKLLLERSNLQKDSFEGKVQAEAFKAMSRAESGAVTLTAPLKSLGQTPIAALGQSVQSLQRNLEKNNLGFISTAISPFTRTLFNTMQQSVDRAPVLGVLQSRQRFEDLAGVNGLRRQREVMGRQIVGTQLGLVGVWLASQGSLHFSAPDKATEFDRLSTTGFQGGELSYRAPDGSIKSFDVGRFSPVSDHLYYMATLGQVGSYLERDEGELAANFLLNSITEAAGSGRYVKSLTDILGVLADDVSYVSGWDKAAAVSKNFVLAALQPRIVGDFKNIADPYLRKGYTFFEQYWSRVPGFSESADHIYNSFGEPTISPQYMDVSALPGFMNSKEGLTNSLETLSEVALPIASKNILEDPITLKLEEMAELGHTIPRMGATLSVGNEVLDLRKYRHKKTGQSAYGFLQEKVGATRGGLTLRERLNKLVTSDFFVKNLTDTKNVRFRGDAKEIEGTRFKVINRYIKKYRDLAKKELKANYREFESEDGPTLFEDYVALQRAQQLNQTQATQQQLEETLEE